MSTLPTLSSHHPHPEVTLFGARLDTDDLRIPARPAPIALKARRPEVAARIRHVASRPQLLPWRALDDIPYLDDDAALRHLDRLLRTSRDTYLRLGDFLRHAEAPMRSEVLAAARPLDNGGGRAEADAFERVLRRMPPSPAGTRAWSIARLNARCPRSGNNESLVAHLEASLTDAEVATWRSSNV